MKVRKRLFQYVAIVLANAITLILIAVRSNDLEIQSVTASIGVSVAFIATQVVYWWLFINFLSSLPVWLYPLVTLILSGGIFMLFANLVPGVLIASIKTSLSITGILASLNAILGSLLSLDLETKFDSNVTRKLVARVGTPIVTDIPGFVYLEIDGLSEKVFRQALEEGYMPTLKRWLDEGTHHILSWETEFTSQTCAMQSGILDGNNIDVPAYRWWDRHERRVVVGGNPIETTVIESRLTSGRGLLSNGGASRGNMFSGDASESLFTFSTMFDLTRGKGPGFYLYLVSPFLTARLVTRFVMGLFKEWWQSIRQRIRKDKYIISARNFFYAFLRAAVGPFLQDLTTYVVIGDVLRGLPAIYALYAGYDDISHFAGMDTPEALEVLEETDRYFARIERALASAPRPYHLVVLSDHGQSTGPTFQAKYGITLEGLVKASINHDSKVFASLNTNETWDKINAFLSESIHANTRTALILRTLLQSQMNNGTVALGPERNTKKLQRDLANIKGAHVVVLASGCTGLIYFTQSDRRMTSEEIMSRFPDLLFNLVQHPGIGFLLVRSQEHGDMVLNKEGIYFLDLDTFEGENPLRVYPPNAAIHLKRESSFTNCPDIVVNTTYDPVTEELCCFENQISHHGGIGGPQNYPFVYYPIELPFDGKPVVGSTEVFRLLQGWRDAVQGSTPSNDRTS